MAKKRKAIPIDVRMAVLHEAGFRCANPADRFVLTIDMHHIEYVCVGGPDTAENLLAICRNCHGLHHKGEIPEASIRAWKFLLLALNEAFDRRSVDILIVLYQVKRIERVTSDGLPSYAPLIAGGLASTYQRLIPDGRGGGTPYFDIILTDKGTAFVEGWKKGDQRAALQIPPDA